MQRSTNRSMAVLLVAAAIGLALPVSASDKPPMVVELFTSQGCSSCPPANANLITLGQQPGVLVLSFAVTYWDYLGWKDSFGKPEFTDRQRIYEPSLQQSGPFTPQMVINGATSVVGNDLGEVEGLIASAVALDGPPVILAGPSVQVGPGVAPGPGADVWLVRYDPGLVEVPVVRGENAGRTLPHTHVVHDLQHLGLWNGAAVSFDIDKAPDGLRTAILVQQISGGPILTAISD